MACGLRAMSFDSRYNNPQGTGAVEAYKVFAKQQKIEPIVVQLNGGGEGYWFGPTSAKKVVLFFPGMLPATLTRRRFLYDAVQY